MAGIIAPETPDDPSVYAPNGYSRVDRTWMEGFHAQVTESFNTTAIGPQLWREVDRQMDDTSSPLLTPEQANEQYGIADVLSFDKPINAEHAAERQRLVQDQMRRQSIVDRSGLGTIGRLSASLIGGAADPVNIALAVAPETLLARVGGLGRGAALSLGERVAFGAASGSLGNAVLTPAQAYFAGQEGRQYGIGEALADITLGAAIGGAFPVLGAGLSRANKWYMADADKVVSALEVARMTPTARTMASSDVQLETLSTVLTQKLNGLPTDLTPVLQSIDTINAAKKMEFGNWFGASKAVDEQGVPVRVYHGTDQAFDEFDAGRLGEATGARSAKHGFFFTDSADLASSYATSYDPYSDGNRFVAFINRVTGGGYAKFNNAVLRMSGQEPLEPTGGNVRPTYLSLQNPKIVDFDGAHVSDFTENRFGDLIEQAKRDGHDGVIVRNARDPGFDDAAENLGPSTLYVAFDPKQIRTSIGNSPDGMFRTGGTVEASIDQVQHALPVATIQQSPVVGDVMARADLDAMQKMIDEAPPVPRSTRDEGQVLGQGTAATRELEQFAAQDEAVLQALRDQGRLTAADEAQFEQISELEKQYKELADARSRAVTCFMMEGNG